MSVLSRLSVFSLSLVISAAIAQTPVSVVQLPVSSAQLTHCVTEPSAACAARRPQSEFSKLPATVRQALRSHGSLLKGNSEYPADPADAVYFLLPQQGDVQPLLSWTDSVSIKIVLATVKQGKVVSVLRIANDGPDETLADSFSIDADQSIRLYQQKYGREGAAGHAGKKRLLGVYRIQPDGSISRVKAALK